VIEQITYLLFRRLLDNLQTKAESKARILGGPIDDSKYLPGREDLRRASFAN
jgi:type I restriction enzyme M protein